MSLCACSAYCACACERHKAESTPLALDNQAQRRELAGPIADDRAFALDAARLPIEALLQQNHLILTRRQLGTMKGPGIIMDLTDHHFTGASVQYDVPMPEYTAYGQDTPPQRVQLIASSSQHQNLMHRLE